MSKIIRFAPRLKRVGQALRNAPLFLVCAVVSIAVEAFAAGGIFQENTARVQIAGFHVSLAYAEAIMSVACSLGSLVLSAAAASHKADPRPEQRKRAFGAQALAVALLAAPVYYAGDELALQAQTAKWREYAGSTAEAADRGLATDPQVDSIVRQNAAESLKQGIRPLRAEFDPFTTAWIAFLLGCNMIAVRVGWRPRPETPAQAKARNKKPDDLTNVEKLRRRS